MNEDVREITDALKRGNTILYPSDTLWALGCDATNEKAVERIFSIKERPENKPFIVLVNSVMMLERYVPEFPEVCYDLIDNSEKPLTIIFDNPDGLPDLIKGEDGSLGIRITKDPLCSQIIRGLNKPLLSTSANKHGKPFPKSFEEIDPVVIERTDFVLNPPGHRLLNVPSSIIKIGTDSSVKIIRR
ncbi:MAG: L-threonylcarbamoyladenylate synthase [Brumimicrobium sp.]|nr:L-threonylcarbamoyladenylate synthase [Brumimicrobium sp.]